MPQVSPRAPWWTEWNLSYGDDVFGNIYGGHSVQEAFYTTIKKWFPTYIAEMNRQLGAEVLKDPKEYRFRPDNKTNPRGVEADILVTVPGTTGRPERLQDAWRVNFTVDVIIFIYGTTDWQETQALTYAYAACLRAIALQKGDLGRFAVQTLWDSEEYLEGEHQGTRTTGIAHLKFTVTIGAALKNNGGLPDPAFAGTGVNTGPSIDPPAPVPVVDTTNITLIKEPNE